MLCTRHLVDSFSKFYQPIVRNNLNRFVTTLSPIKITEILRRNEKQLSKDCLPTYIKSIECNQLASNDPIEDRLRITSINQQLCGFNNHRDEPTLILGVFDGHGGGTTADIISKRLFHYIALSFYLRENANLRTATTENELKDLLVNLHQSPKLKQSAIELYSSELKLLMDFKNFLLSQKSNYDVANCLKASFNQCDADLSNEIRENLSSPRLSNSGQSNSHYYLSAAVSGCCALVLVIHRGIGYLASTGDCRGVLGTHYHVKSDEKSDKPKEVKQKLASKKTKSIKEVVPLIPPSHKFQAVEMNEEHNCDNINEIRRLASTHPISEQNTMIKHNRLLGHLMPFRAFGDFTYKWPAELTISCGITKAFGTGVIPSHYKTPPYLIAEPDTSEFVLDDKKSNQKGHQEERLRDGSGQIEVGSHDQVSERFIVLGSDGLWELFESSRDVIETIVDHSINSTSQFEYYDDIDDDLIIQQDYYDENSATHTLRSALRSGSQQEFGLEPDELKRLYHIRLESTLTLPQSVVRNFRDDISLIVLKM